MISKSSGVKWLQGKFIETVKNWQEEWFYMADVPLSNREGIATPFSATPPERLHSWTPKNIHWEETEELTKLIERVEYFIEKGVTLIDVMHVALYRGIQPLQALAHPMWEFDRETDETSAIRAFYGKRTIAGMQTLLFTTKDQAFRIEGVDVGYWAKRRTGKVQRPTLSLVFRCF